MKAKLPKKSVVKPNPKEQACEKDEDHANEVNEDNLVHMEPNGDDFGMSSYETERNEVLADCHKKKAKNVKSKKDPKKVMLTKVKVKFN